MIQSFNGLQVEVTETRDHKQWYMTVEQVATGYGVARTTIMNHLRDHANELREGIERDGVRITDTIGRRQTATILYRDGAVDPKRVINILKIILGEGIIILKGEDLENREI